MRHKSFSVGLTIGLATPLAILGWAAVPSGEQETFATPKEAAAALLTAAEAHDLGALKRIFGPEAEEILNSGDPVQDKANRTQFIERAKTSLKEKITPGENRAILLIGRDNFPFPIPLKQVGARWYFDTPAGKNEILMRRIGSNELDAIATCKAYVDAQYDYASEDRNHNGVPEYARKLLSSPGKRDGLFWPGPYAAPTQFSEKVKQARAQGYQKADNAPAPYHGYYFRVLTAQGPNARGGAENYLEHGLMIGGFGLVAWPAEYRVSGVKTFIVNQDGGVYERDLGASTDTTAQAMTKFNPDRTWRRVR